MNRFCTSERLSGLLAFALSGLLHIVAGVLVIFLSLRPAGKSWPAMGPKAVNLSFAQIELQSAAASSSRPASPEPAPLPEPADVALKEIQKAPEPEPEASPEPEVLRPAEAEVAQKPTAAQTAQTAQEASAQRAQIEAAESFAGLNRTGTVNWRMLAVAKLRAMVEREKYYPPAAQKAGYTGRVSVLIRLEPDGMVSGYEVRENRGHPMLSRAVETTLEEIKGQNIGLTLPERFEILLPIEFELN